MPPSAPQQQHVLARAFAAHEAGDLAQAEFFYKLVLQGDRKQFDALHMLGLIEAQRGNYAAGVVRLREALRVRSNSVDALINLGRMQAEIGQYADAVKTYKKALTLDPKSALAHSNLSIVLRRQARPEEALAHCDAALKIAPEYAAAWSNRGNALYDLKRMAEALHSYDQALRLQPTLGGAHLGRGNVLHRLQRYQEALAAYARALAVKPDDVDCHLGRGNVFADMVQMAEALDAYDRALAIEPGSAEAWFGRGLALSRLAREAEAFEAFARAFAIRPDLPVAEGARLSAKLSICSWTDLDAEREHLHEAIRSGQPRCDPFRYLAMAESAADQFTCALHYSARSARSAAAPLWRGEHYRHERIRVAYLSSDFRHHAVAYLTAGMFERHDRSRFDLTAISYGPATNDEVQLRLRAAFDRFCDVGLQPDRAVAELLRELEIDIAVDLSGLAGNSRPGILVERAVPIQVNYLGFAGTMGADYVDYILADDTVIPAEHAAFYSEQVVWLPDTFMATDDRRGIADRVPSRQECALPDSGFVFCCFNNAFKITPSVFTVWMNILRAVEGSVLWLSNLNAAAKSNLRREAATRGVSPERLVFAAQLPDVADHLARLRQADLFLDTLPYNAHTTANDALWAGVPVVTCLGATFPGRVAASLLRAVGLGDLVTGSLAQYEALALSIAADPALRGSLAQRLACNKTTAALFDTARFTRNIEAAYTAMWQRQQRGEPPASFTVRDTSPAA